jgi:hypothetical protein
MLASRDHGRLFPTHSRPKHQSGDLTFRNIRPSLLKIPISTATPPLLTFQPPASGQDANLHRFTTIYPSFPSHLNFQISQHNHCFSHRVSPSNCLSVEQYRPFPARTATQTDDVNLLSLPLPGHAAFSHDHRHRSSIVKKVRWNHPSPPSTTDPHHFSIRSPVSCMFFNLLSMLEFVRLTCSYIPVHVS